MKINIDKTLTIFFNILTVYFFVHALITTILLIGKLILKSNVSTGYAIPYLILYIISTILSNKLANIFNSKNKKIITNVNKEEKK